MNAAEHHTVPTTMYVFFFVQKFSYRTLRYTFSNSFVAMRSLRKYNAVVRKVAMTVAVYSIIFLIVMLLEEVMESTSTKNDNPHIKHSDKQSWRESKMPIDFPRFFFKMLRKYMMQVSAPVLSIHIVIAMIKWE